jgi:alpha-glucosidase
LLPYLYNVMHQSSESGLPAMRPLFVEFPDDEATATTDDEFLFGSDLLVAPVLWEGVSDRAVYLPKGDWYEYWTGRHFEGETTIRVPVTLETLPIFVRGGAFIFRQPVVQYTGQMAGNPLRVLVAPTSESSSVLYEDDGKSLQYRHGAWMKRRFQQSRDDKGIMIQISAPEGSFRPAARDLILEVWTSVEPSAVELGSGAAPLPRLAPAALAGAQRGWSYSEGMITIKDQDHFTEERLSVAYERPTVK